MGISDKPSLGAAGGYAIGSTTLVAGVKVVSIPGLTASSIALIQPTGPAGTLGAVYKAVCTQDTLTITSLTAALATQVLDISAMNYLAVF